MLNILFMILYFLLMIVLIIGGVILLKKYLFNKVRINKYIPLAGSIIVLIIQFIFKSNNIIVTTAVTLLIVFLFAWFWDIQQTGGVKKEKKIVIKPKAKPNRVKNKK